MAVIACPYCGTQLDAPDDVLGRQVVCGRCSRTFVAESRASEPQPEDTSAAGPPVPPPGPGAPGEAPPSAAPAPPPAAGAAFARPVGTGYGQPLKSSGYAVASLVLGIASMPTCFCLGLPAIVCGILAIVFQKNAMRDIEAGVVSASSAGMAKAGRICGMIGIFLGIGYWVVYIGAIVVSTAF